MENIFHFIGKAFVTVALAVAGIFGGSPALAPDTNVGAAIPIPVAVFQTSLASSITASATSMTLVSGTDKSGDALSGYICFNIDEGTSLEEFVCGTASGTSVTSMLRGIDPIDGDLEVTALKKAHRRGASVKVTNYPSLGILSRILNGNETIPNPITYAAGTSPVGSKDLADKAYVLSVVTGGAVTFEKVVIAGTAGETVAAGNLLYLDSSDSEWKKTDADTAGTVENVILGIAQGAGTDGVAITGGVLIRGIDENQTGLTASTIYYASNTAGALSSSAGTKEVTIGIATDTTDIVFAPRYNQQITEDQQDALAGGGALGTPSSSNKYQTQEGVTAAFTTLTATDPVVRTYLNAGSPATWTKPAGLKYVIVEVQAGGGGGQGGNSADTGGGADGGGGGYSKKLIAVASLGATETVTTGAGGTAGASANPGATGGTGGASSFGAHATTTGGAGGGNRVGGEGGIGSSGDVNVKGGGGGSGTTIAGTPSRGGGSSHLGGGGIGRVGDGTGADGGVYGGGGTGGIDNGAGGVGGAGIVIVTEYYY